MTKPNKAKVTTSKRKPKETLFPMGKMSGEVAPAISDESVADSVVAQCGNAIELLRKIGKEARVSAVKRIAKLLDSVSPSTNTAVFLREKPESNGADLFDNPPKTTEELFG